MVDKNKGGRPIEREAPKLMPLNMRTSPVLREKIERAAEKFGRSLTQEVERRLEMSFMSDELLGGSHNNTFMRMALGAIAQIEGRNGASWLEDHDTFRAVRAALDRLLVANSPLSPIPEQALIDPARADYERAKQEEEVAGATLNDYRREVGLPIFDEKSFLPGLRSIRSVPTATGLFGSSHRPALPTLAGPPLTTGGLLSGLNFAAGSELSEEQCERLASLEAAALAARLKTQEKFTIYSAEVDKMDASFKAAQATGREAAMDQYRLLGPKRKPS